MARMRTIEERIADQRERLKALQDQKKLRDLKERVRIRKQRRRTR